MPEPTESARRLPPLEGGRNFRDLGGYLTTDGRCVRWGRVYRSGVLTYLTDADHDLLARLGVRTICDFRSPAERQREPTHWRTAPPEALHWDYDFERVSLRGLLREVTELSAEVMRHSMMRLYGTLPELFATPYADLFACLARDATPLVFHCAAGKDRTGIAAALVLTSLGVARDTVIDDYLLTNSVVDLDAALRERPRSSVGVGDERVHLGDITAQVRAPLLAARREYLEAAFAQIESDHGSIPRYLCGRLGVTDEMLGALRRHLLES